jgi:hypothetical protein
MADEVVSGEQAAAPAETADPTTKIEAPAPETAAETTTETAETPAETTETTEGEESQEPKKKVPGSQRLKRRLELIEGDYLAQQSELETLRREKQERERGAQNPEGRPGVDREPKEADFANDWFAFQEAKTAWAARQAVREEFNRARDEQQQSGNQRAQNERRREVLEAYHEYADEVRERIPDFDKVVSAAKDVTVKPEVIDELLASDKSALLQYHLAKNPDKARELNGMTGRELAREIGRLESRVHLPTPKKATEADPPPSQVRGAAAKSIDPQTGPDDMNAYAAWRRKKSAS